MKEIAKIDRCPFCELPFYANWAHTPQMCWDTQDYDVIELRTKRKFDGQEFGNGRSNDKAKK